MAFDCGPPLCVSVLVLYGALTVMHAAVLPPIHDHLWCLLCCMVLFSTPRRTAHRTALCITPYCFVLYCHHARQAKEKLRGIVAVGDQEEDAEGGEEGDVVGFFGRPEETDKDGAGAGRRALSRASSRAPSQSSRRNTATQAVLFAAEFGSGVESVKGSQVGLCLWCVSVTKTDIGYNVSFYVTVSPGMRQGPLVLLLPRSTTYCLPRLNVPHHRTALYCLSHLNVLPTQRSSVLLRCRRSACRAHWRHYRRRCWGAGACGRAWGRGPGPTPPVA